MRILILNHNDRDKGTYFRCFSLGKNLVKVGHDVVLSCLNTDGSLFRTATEFIDGVKLVLVPGQFGSSSIRELPFHFFRAVLNIKMTLLGKFDAVYAFNVASPTTGIPIVILKLLKKVGIFSGEILVDSDDLWGRGGLTSIDGKGGLAVWVAGFMETKIPLLADKVTIVSHFLKDMLIKAGVDPDKAFIVPNGADVSGPYFADTTFPRAELGLPADKPILCFVGRALWVFDYLLAALSIVVRKKPDTLIVYISPLQDTHMKAIQQLGLSSNFICPGVQPHDVVCKYLSAADVLLLPRMRNGIEQANFPGRLGDYLAAGRPIVSTAIEMKVR